MVVAVVAFPPWRVDGKVGGDSVGVGNVPRQVEGKLAALVAVQFVGQGYDELAGYLCILPFVLGFHCVP